MKANKKTLIIIFLVFLSVTCRIQAEPPEFELTASSAILVEAETGEILFEKNPYLKLPPASMTKIMTMLLAMEALETGRANLEDRVIISEHSAEMGGSQVFLEAGEEMTMEELMKAIAIASANDASVALAEYLYGTEQEFVRRMNQRASELGLENTYYYNTNGLPPDEPEVQGNYTTAYDLAQLSRELLKYPLVLEWTSTWIDYLRDGKFVLNNTNRLVRHFQGADGIKTGHTRAAKFCVTTTASRNQVRLIAVIMGAPASSGRFEEAARLLTYGFNCYQRLVIADSGDVLSRLNIWNAQDPGVEVVTLNKVTVPVKKGEEDLVNSEVVLKQGLTAPLSRHQTAGFLRIYRGNLLIKEVELVVASEVKKASLGQMFPRVFFQMIRGVKNLFT